MKLVVILLLTFNGAIDGSAVSWSSVTNPLKNVWSSLYSFDALKNPLSSDKGCNGCEQNQVIAEIGQDPILTELRVEYVKQQILKKLRLERPPEVSLSLKTLPKPLINGNVLELRPGEPMEPEKPAESFYGKTDQVVVFPNEGESLVKIHRHEKQGQFLSIKGGIFKESDNAELCRSTFFL